MGAKVLLFQNFTTIGIRYFSTKCCIIQKIKKPRKFLFANKDKAFRGFFIYNTNKIKYQSHKRLSFRWDRRLQ